MRLTAFLDRSAAVARTTARPRWASAAALALAAVLTTGCDRPASPDQAEAANRPALSADLLRDLQMVQEVPLRQADAAAVFPAADEVRTVAPVRRSARRVASPAPTMSAAERLAAQDPAVAAALADPAYAAGPTPEQLGQGAAPEPMVRAIRVPAGTMSAIRLSDALSNRTHKAGDLIVSTLAEDIYGEDGTTLLPAGLPVIVRLRSIEHAENARSARPVVFDLVAMRIQGQTVPLRGVASAMPDLVDRGLTAGQAAKMGVGVGAGAIVGDQIGGRTGAIIGGVVGGLAGRHVANRTADYDVLLPVDAQVQMRLDQDIRVTLRQAGFDDPASARVIR